MDVCKIYICMFGKDLYKWVCIFTGDMYPGPDGDLEPEWVKNEKEQFSQYRDKDGDGFMDKEEVSWCVMSKSWISYFQKVLQ